MAHLKFGFHQGPTGPKPPFSFYQTLDDAGIPFVLKITDAAPPLEVLDLARNSTVNHIIVYRRSEGLTGGDGVYSVPDYSLPPQQAAQKHFDLHFQELPPEVVGYRDVCWIETINETNKDDDRVVEWTAEFSIYHSQLWLDRGFKYLCFGWAGGCPEPHHWRGPKMLQLLRLCAERPYTLGIALHEYSLSKDIWSGTSADGSRWMIGRFEHLHKTCDDNDIMRPRIVMTEWGWGKDEILLPQQWERIEDYGDVGEYYAMYANIQGAAVWCLNQGDEWGNIHTKIQSDINSILAMTLNTTYPDPPIWPYEENPMPDKPKIVILKKPQKAQMTEAENEQANERAWNDYGRTATHSDDDMLTMLSNGNDESYAIVCWPERQPNTVQMLENAGYPWVMFPEEVPPVAWTSVNVPHMSQFGGGADARSNDCGAACVAMIVNGQTANRPTVDNVAIKYQNPANSYMNFSHLDSALNGYGMDGVHKRPYTPPQISTDIASGKAVIALVWYQSLPFRFSSFNGSHFIVMYATNKSGTMRYRDPLCPDGRTLEIAYDVLEKAMRDAQNSGNYPNQGMVCSVKAPPSPTGRTVDMLPYFSPPAGTPYGPVTIKDTNWDQGQVRQQIQAHGDYIYVTKGKEFEARKLIGDRIFLIMDDSPGDGKYYTVQSADGWIPRHFTEGQSFTRKETAVFYHRSNCSATGESSNWTNVIRFTKFYSTWATPGGLPFSNVCHLQWLVNGVLEEDYWLAPHVGYAMWQNRHGRQSYVVSMPQGQGNNTFDGACYWPAFGKEW